MSTTPEPPVAAGKGRAPLPDGRLRRRRWPYVLTACVILLLAWGAFAAAKAWSAYGHAKDGLSAMSDVRGAATKDLPTFIESIGGSVDDTPEERIPSQLDVASKAFAQAHDEVSSPIFAPLRILPVIGRQVGSATAMTAAAATTARDAGSAFGELSKEASNKASTPEARLASAQRTQRTLQRLQRQMKALDLGPDEGLVGPVARARDRFTEEYDHTMATLDRAVASVTAVDRLLTGPSKYLVLAANNAEMRSGSGMYLQAGEMVASQGRFQLGEFVPTSDLVLQHPGAAVDPDIQKLWGWLQPSQEYRNLNVTPRFDESARMASEMWANSGHGKVDGVIAIDVLALERLLKIVGPVQVQDADGGVSTVSADNVRQELLLDQYLGLGATTDPALTAQRRERLGRVGTAVFESFNQRRFSAYRLLQALQESGAGRNLLMWSSDRVEEAGWKAIGAAGELPEDSMLLGILNRGGNKLDQFLGVDSVITAAPAGKNRRVSVKVTMTNRTPSTGLPTYVTGPFPGTSARPGEYIGLLALTVPKGAGNPSSSGAELQITGDDGPTRVLTTRVDLQAGATTTVTIEFDLPRSWQQIEVQPSARAPEVNWTAGAQSWTDATAHTVYLADLG